MTALPLKVFLTDYSESLANKVVKTLQVVHDPVKDQNPDLDVKLARMTKPLFASQAEIAKACYKSFLTENRGVYIVAECGTGKTLMSIGVVNLMHTFQDVKRVLVLCPPTIVKKWITEIRDSLPNSKVFNLNTKNITKELLQISRKNKATTLEFYIIGRERAKIGAPWRPAGIIRNGIFHCPRCNKAIMDKDDYPVNLYQRTKQRQYKKKHVCAGCGEQLWQPDRTKNGFRRVIPAKFINKRMAGFFDLLIADEVHQFKNQTGQGYAFGALSAACKYTLCLTGTLVGGYASDIYHLMYRTHPKIMLDDGNKWNMPRQFIERYGTLEKIKPADEIDGLMTKAKQRTYVREKPGISPVMIANMLLPHCVFLRLSDCIGNLQPYEEKVIELDMSPDMAKAYRDFEQKLKDALLDALASNDSSLLGGYINSLLTYTERISAGVTVLHPYTKEVVAVGEPVDGVMPKEEELASIISEEKAAGRKVLVYFQSSGQTDISDRLLEILEPEGVKAKVLKSGNTEKRAEIIQGWVDDDVDVVFTNPKKVEVGMDLLDFPTIIFYQIPTSTYTLRQASRRSWRIPQTKPVNVYFFVYSETMQSKLLQLMANKLMSSMAVEGELNDDGLNAMANVHDGNIARELAKILVENMPVGSGESLKDTWAGYRKNEVKADQYLSDGKVVDIIPMDVSDQPDELVKQIDPETKIVKMESQMEQIGDFVVKVKFTEYTGKRKKKITHVEVTQSELDKMVKESKGPVIAQLSLF